MICGRYACFTKMTSQFLHPLTLLCIFTIFSSSSSQPHHLHKPSTTTTCTSATRASPQQYIELTRPLPTDHLPPSCTHSILRHAFADTMGQPPITVPYSPPSSCPPPWSHVILHLSAASFGDQYDRIAAVWLDGAEILRTSTPEPTPSGISWEVRRDVTRHSSLLARNNLTMSMMLENLVNDVFTGVYHVNITLLYFYHESRVPSPRQKLVRKLGFETPIPDFLDLLYENEKPADLIVPISDRGHRGFWFRIEDETQMGLREIRLPMNARRLVLELYVSFHGNDEFWYSNPPDIYIETNNLASKRGNGAFREVVVRIDGTVVASQVPVPVIFTGGINPLFWEPVVGIGAFDLPSYDFDLTPFLGWLLDGKNHSFELGVAGAIQFWLVDANLHVWLDDGSSRAEAELVLHQPPQVHQSWEWEFEKLDGSFRVEAERKSVSSGWLASSFGNVSTSVVREIKSSNWITFEGNGTYQKVRQKVKTKIEVRIESKNGELVSRSKWKRKYPLVVITSTVPLSEKDTYTMTTNMSQSLEEKFTRGEVSSTVLNTQESGGWMLVKDHDVLSGTASTSQNFIYLDPLGCYSRNIEATNGQLLRDDSTTACPSSFQLLGQ